MGSGGLGSVLNLDAAEEKDVGEGMDFDEVVSDDEGQSSYLSSGVEISKAESRMPGVELERDEEELGPEGHEPPSPTQLFL